MAEMLEGADARYDRGKQFVYYPIAFSEKYLTGLRERADIWNRPQTQAIELGDGRVHCAS
jgi:hypothetical protein